jgi:iron(III) transport system permease protein
LAAVLFSLAGPCCLVVSTFQGEGSYGLDPWRNVLSDLGRWRTLLLNSGLAAGAATSICLPIGALLAFLLFRTDLWGRRMGLALLFFTAALPLYVVNGAVLAIFGTTALRGSALAVGGIHALAHLPVAIVLMGISFQAVRREIEELALMEGAGPIRVFFAVTLRSALGSVLASFLWILWWLTTDYSVSDVLLVRTFPEELYTQFALNGRPAEPALVSLPQMLIFGALLWSFRRGLFSTEGKVESGRPPRPFRLGRWRLPITLAVYCFLLLLALMPVALLVTQLGPIKDLLQFAAVFAPEIRTSLWTSFAAGLLCAGLSPGLAWYFIRRPRWRVFLGLYVIVMLAFPAPLLGMGLIQLFNHEGLLGTVYDSPCMLLLAYTVRFLPLGVLLLTSSLQNLHRELETMARVDGCGELDVLRRIVVPLSLPAVLMTLFVTMILSLGELPCSLLVTPPGYATVASRFFSMIHYGLYRDAAALCLLSILCVLLPWAGLMMFLRKRFACART